MPSSATGPPPPPSDAALRADLTATIFRNRLRPPVPSLLTPASAPPAATPFTAVHTAIARDHPDLAWDTVTLRLHDPSDVSQTRLTLLLAKLPSTPPAAAPLPTVCLLHQTAHSYAHPRLVHRLAALARRGYLAVALNSRHHGCRGPGEPQGKEAYLRALVRAWRANSDDAMEGRTYPFIYDTAADLFSVMDYLHSRDDVDRASIALAGFSLGGMHAWIAAAADPRWTCVAPLIGVQGFAYAVERACFQARVDSIREVFEAARADLGRDVVCKEVVREVWDRICPGLLDRFDCGMSLALLWPRPVFVGNGELDPRCPVQPVQEAVREVKERYVDEGVGEFVFKVYEGVGHEVTEEMWADCVAFLDRWVRGPRGEVAKGSGEAVEDGQSA